MSTTRRDEIAEILESIEKDGMPHPRNLDAALDAIECSFRMKQYVGIHSHGHGMSVYSFECPEDQSMGVDDFITYLGNEFEPDREEWVEIYPIHPVQFPFEKED